ncbi:MAG: hypothetical protein GF398_21360 [Chitinivibrionales bacterium]|nr:hypothetical protein [Chitinivibrionales bacterium]
MSGSAPQLSQEMYHRIYRLIKRDVEPALIATALKLPLETVLSIVSRYTVKKSKDANSKAESAGRQEEQIALEFYMYSKSRYAIYDVTGRLTQETGDILNQELAKILESPWKAAALKLTEVNELDECAATSLEKFAQDFAAKGKYAALLDPSPGIEPAIASYHLDNRIPIFGTERAFEENAFKIEASQKTN